MEITHSLHGTITGNRLMTVKAHGSWRDSMTTVGKGQHSISLAGTKLSRDDWRARTSHWACSLVEWHDGVPKWFGPIRRRRWDHVSKVLTLETVAPAAVFESRYTVGVGSYATDPTFEITGASLASAVERALYRGIGGGMPTWGPEWGLPLRFHRLAEAGTFSKAYPKSDRKSVARIVSELRRMDGGPDLALVPFVEADGSVSWDVLTGAPRVSGPTLPLMLSVRNGAVKALVTDEDGDNMASGVFGHGEGLGDDRKVGLAGYFGGPPVGAPPMIVRDVATNFGVSNDDLDLLNSQSQEYLDAHTWPTKQLEFGVTVEQHPGRPSVAANLRLGTRLASRFSGDEFEPPFAVDQYIVALGFSTTKPDEYTVEVQRL